MAHVIRYFKDGVEYHTTSPGSLEALKKIALAGVARHGMDFAIIADEAGNVVWASGNHIPEKRRGIGEMFASLLRVFGGRHVAL